MTLHPEEFLFEEDLAPERREALLEALQADASLRQAWTHWQQVRAALRGALATAVPDRSLLVAYVLAEAQPEALTPAERDWVAAHRRQLEAAFRRHPGLDAVVQHIRAEKAAFEQVWATHFETPGTAAADRGPAARRRSRLRWPMRVGVGLAVVAFAAIGVLLLQRDAQVETIRTAAGEVRLVDLGGGSTVRLLGGSVFSFVPPDRPTGLSRPARLEGQAYFDITPGRQGFVVETATARVTVLGTRFGVQAEKALTEVVLARGRLSLAPRDVPRQVVVLSPGEMSRVGANALPATPVAIDVAEELFWTGLFVFEATPLRVIAARLSAHYGRPVGVDDALADEAVTGTFEQRQTLAEILDVLAATLGAEVRATNAGFRLAAVGA